MEKRNPKDWITEIAESPDFLRSFKRDPATTLQERSFHLHESYKRLMGQLTEEQKEAMAQAFDQIAKTRSPEELRQTYAEWAEQYELIFRWEGLREIGLRGWTQ